MKNILLLLILGMFLISCVSSAEWDNKITYSNNDLTISLDNWFGLGINYGTAELKSHSSIDEIRKVGAGEQVVMWYDFDFKEIYENGLGDIEFKDMKTGKIIEKDYSFIYETTIVVNDTIIIDNKEDKGYKSIVIGNHEENIWVLYNSKDIPTTKIRIGLLTNVEVGDYTDAVWTIGGKKVLKHASWTSSLNVDLDYYYKEDVLNGTSDGTYNNITDLYDMVVTDGIVITGKVANSLLFEGNGNYSVINDSVDLNETWSINFWVNFTAITGNKYPLFASTSAGGGSDKFQLGANSTGSIQVDFRLANTTQETIYSNSSVITTNKWNMTTLTFDNGDARLYINGVFVGNENINANRDFTSVFVNMPSWNQWDGGALDEIGLWSRELTNAEVTQLYNEESGLTYSGILITTLISPQNDSQMVTNTTDFSLNVSDLYLVGIKNVSLIINGTINQTNSSHIQGFYNFTDIVIPNGYWNWSVETYDNSSSRETASNGTLVFTIADFIENSQTFNNETIEGNIETFVLNITIESVDSITEVNLDYNGTSRSATTISLGDDMYNLTSTFTIPSVTADVNMSFFWIIDLAFGQENSTSNNQTVRNIDIDNCSINTNVIFNYTMVDEESQTQLIGATDNTTLELDIEIFNSAKTISITNFSTSYNQTNPVAVCLNLSLTNETIYALDSTVKYQADDHVIEYYNIQNFELKNSTVPQNINLFDLLTADSTEFQITFKDVNFVVVEDALIQINRQYVSEGVFKTVEIPKTDSNGQTVAHLVEKDIVYNIIVLKEGVILGTFNNIIAFCEDVLIGSCFITLNALEAGEAVFDYDDEIGLFFSFEYNETTRVLQFDFTTTDGSVQNISLSSIKMDQLGNTSVCDSYLVSSSGSLYCTVPASIGNETIIVKIYVDGDLKITNYVSAGTEFDIGDAGYFLMFFLVLSLALMMTQSKIGVIIGVVIGFITASLLSLFKGGIIGVGSSIMWLMIMAVILIWKLNSQRQT